jgi:hypothetical protein
MGHTKPESLIDLEHEFEIIRSLEGVKEKKPGIFYLKATSFLHFHDKDGKRWADVKTHDGWLQLDIDFDANPKSKLKFIKAAKDAHAAFTRGKIKK